MLDQQIKHGYRPTMPALPSTARQERSRVVQLIEKYKMRESGVTALVLERLRRDVEGDEWMTRRG